MYEGIFKPPNDLNFIKNDIEKLEVSITVKNISEIPPEDLGVGIRIFDSRKYIYQLSYFYVTPK